MRKIFSHQKLFLIVFTVIFLQLLFSTGKNVPTVQSAADCTAKANGKKVEITYKIYDGAGFFCGTDWTKNGFPYSYIRSPDNSGCANNKCVGSEKVECGLDQSIGDKQISDAAIAFAKIQPDEDVYINNVLTCDTPFAPAPPGPPCAKWQDPGPESGVCEEVATSLPSGNISTNPGEFIVRIFTIILGLAGGIALLLFLSAGYKIIMSNGKPEGIQQGREQLISAIIGLVFIIFSFVIFQLVAVDILKIPGIK